MKKTTFLLITILLVSLSAKATTGWFNDFVKLNVNSAGEASYWIGTDPSSGTALQGATLGSVTSLQLTGCDMKYWSDSQDRTGGSFFYKIMSADGLTQIVAPTETVWTQTALGGNDFQGTTTIAVNLLTGLPYGTYQLHVWAKNWGSNQGDSWLSNNSANYVATFTNALPVMVYGSATIVDGTGYTTLKAAFDALNLIADQNGKNIEIKISGNTTETATAALNQPATASWTSLTIYPTATATVSGSFVGTIVDLNGADNVTINGKLNKTGANKSLTISHTSNADNGNRTIRLWNDAKNNTIQYCTIVGSCPSSGAGVILLGDALATTGTGNDDNVIEENDVNAAGAANGIKATSANAFACERNIVRNNNIFDFYINNTSTTATAGIDFGTNYTISTISGNSLYQTASRAYSATSTLHLGINVGGTSNSNTITDNYIGGSAPLCGGVTPWTVTGGLYRLFTMQFSFGTTTPVSSVQNNIIANLDITTEVIANASSAFIGFQHGGTGSANYGTTTGNTIGSSTSVGSIKLKYTGATVGSLNVGFNIAGGAVTISNNKIGGIIVDLNNSANRAHFYGISTAGATLITITKNTIGSETIANSIEHKGSTTVTANQANLRGITVGNTGGSIIEENIISNLTSNSTGAGMTINGIYTNSAASGQSISKNIVRNLTNYGTRVSTGTAASIIGLCINTGGSSSGINTIGNNKVFTFNNATTTADGVEAYGIYFETSSTGSATLENNKIYDIKTSSTSTNANIIGLYIGNGLTTTKNNMISLGSGLTSAYNISGIRKSNTKNNSFYHNTVLLTGIGVGVAGTTNTYAFYKTGSGTDILLNNILINERSNASGNTQKHYVLNVNDLTTFTSDYNVAYHPGTGGLLGAVGATDYATGETWGTGTSKDANSKIQSVYFVDATTGNLNITGTSINDALLGMPNLATVTTDIANATRNTPLTYAGAHEASNLNIPAPSKTFTVTVPNGTAKVYVAGIFTGKKWDLTTPHELVATANPNEFTGTFACTNDVAYKYLCEKVGDWDYQEAIYQGTSDPIPASNRNYNAADVVPIWYRINKLKLNVSFEGVVPSTLFLKNSGDNWTSPDILTHNGNTYSVVIGGTPGAKFPANTQYKYYTNDEVNDNWECNADGSPILAANNRWSVAPVLNDVIARFTTALVSGLNGTKMNARIMHTSTGIEVAVDGKATIELYTVNGIMLDKTNANGTYKHELNNGVYIIRINGISTKFVK